MQMDIKVVILGRTGVLGDAIFDVFSQSRTTLQTDGPTLILPPNLRSMINERSIFDWLKAIQPDYILNCVSINGIRRCYEDPVSAFRVNAVFPQLLAAKCAQLGIKLIHFSTEMVFNGSKKLPSPVDLPNPQTIYGESKYLGEISANPLVCTIRLPLLFSYKKNSQIVWRVIDQLGKSGSAVASNDEYSTPVMVEDVAFLLATKILDDSIAFGGTPIHCASQHRETLVESIRRFCYSNQLDAGGLREVPSSQFAQVEAKPKNLGLLHSSGYCLPSPGTVPRLTSSEES